jgi:hypothetical protein
VFPDFEDLLSTFNAQGVEYLVVGGHALAAHGHVRATKDLDVWEIGVPPLRIDIITAIDGVDFDAAWPNRVTTKFAGEPGHVLSIPDLITNKRAAGRLQDLADVEQLERLLSRRSPPPA